MPHPTAENTQKEMGIGTQMAAPAAYKNNK